MGVDVSNLTASPSAIKEGKTKVKMSFGGFVETAASDNPVSLKLYIEPLSPAHFIENGVQKKVISKKETFNENDGTQYSWNTEIEITTTPNLPTSCSLRLEAVDANGGRSATNSSFIYY